MLETPLYGKLANEDRLVVFSAPTEYHALVRICVVGGGLAAAYGFLGFFGVTDPPVGTLWFFLTALAVCLAGVFAAYSLAMMRVDMKTGQYRRRDGAGAFGRTRGGPVANLDALVMIAEQDPLRPRPPSTYHLILHWKAAADAPMVVQHDTRAHLPRLAPQRRLQRPARPGDALRPGPEDPLLRQRPLPLPQPGAVYSIAPASL